MKRLRSGVFRRQPSDPFRPDHRVKQAAALTYVSPPEGSWTSAFLPQNGAEAKQIGRNRYARGRGHCSLSSGVMPRQKPVTSQMTKIQSPIKLLNWQLPHRLRLM